MEKYTLITGASSGLGKELALLYAKDNNNLLLVATNETKLKKVIEEVKNTNKDVKVEYLLADLSKQEEREKVYSYTLEKNYFINNLVNNAGFGDQKDFKDMDVYFQLKMLEVNSAAVLYFSRVFLDNMLQHNEGHIINVCSIAGFLPGPYMSTYHASKGYVLLLGEALAYELRKTNVKCLTVCPGPFISDFVEKAHNDYTFKKIKPLPASKVALQTYKKSLKGKSLHIVGLNNKLTLFATRFAPRSFVTKTSAKTTKKED